MTPPPKPTTIPTSNPTESSKLSQPQAALITVRPDHSVMTRQKLPYFVGISGATAGTTNLSMNLVVIPPDGRAEPHSHGDYETAIYILEGRVETFYGPGLKQSVINKTGDFLFIPPGVPHQPHNLSTTTPARALVARNDPNEQENVIPYDPMTLG